MPCLINAGGDATRERRRVTGRAWSLIYDSTVVATVILRGSNVCVRQREWYVCGSFGGKRGVQRHRYAFARIDV